MSRIFLIANWKTHSEYVYLRATVFLHTDRINKLNRQTVNGLCLCELLVESKKRKIQIKSIFFVEKKKKRFRKITEENWQVKCWNLASLALKMDFSGANSINMKPFLGGYPFQGKFKSLESVFWWLQISRYNSIEIYS